MPFKIKKNYLKTTYFNFLIIKLRFLHKNLDTLNHTKHAKSYNTLALVVMVVTAHRCRRDVCMYISAAPSKQISSFTTALSARLNQLFCTTHTYKYVLYRCTITQYMCVFISRLLLLLLLLVFHNVTFKIIINIYFLLLVTYAFTLLLLCTTSINPA